MSDDLTNELEAINSIYGEDTVLRAAASASDLYILSVPYQGVSLRLSFPLHYPYQPPQILATEAIGETARKGYGARILTEARETLGRTFVPGCVCLFDLLQGLEDSRRAQNDEAGNTELVDPRVEKEDIRDTTEDAMRSSSPSFPSPKWTLSETVTLKKSTFTARACPVFSLTQAHAAIADLVTNEKRIAKATHNISAYRIHLQPLSSLNMEPKEVISQDCDDDGETAAGGRLLHLLQVMDVWNVLVVVIRWHGGTQLGPDRFRLISQVARDAVISGGWIKGGGRVEGVQ